MRSNERCMRIGMGRAVGAIAQDPLRTSRLQTDARGMFPHHWPVYTSPFLNFIEPSPCLTSVSKPDLSNWPTSGKERQGAQRRGSKAGGQPHTRTRVTACTVAHLS